MGKLNKYYYILTIQTYLTRNSLISEYSLGEKLRSNPSANLKLGLIQTSASQNSPRCWKLDQTQAEENVGEKALLT